LLLHQVDADVVIRVAELGVDFDGNLALSDGFVQAAFEAVGPAEIGVGVGGGVERDGFFVEPDGAVNSSAVCSFIASPISSMARS
jgi:hypothetical protein